MSNEGKRYTVWSGNKKIGDVYEEANGSDRVRDAQLNLEYRKLTQYLNEQKREEERRKKINILPKEDKELLKKDENEIDRKIFKLEYIKKLILIITAIIISLLLCLLIICWLKPEFNLSRIGEMTIFSWILLLILVALPIVAAIIIAKFICILPNFVINTQLKRLNIEKEILLDKYYRQAVKKENNIY